ncbi:MAG: hypothetical protein JRN46_02045 [Nitrososphaerota archaeon]|nr:hypothetical protein [Nitrososphaerota archaeon]
MSLEDASRKDVVEMLFVRRDSRDVSKALLRWMREGGGRRTGMGCCPVCLVVGRRVPLLVVKGRFI